VVEVLIAAAEDERLAPGRFGEPEQEPQRGRLARTVRAEEAGDGAGANPKRDVIDGRDFPVALGQGNSRDDRLTRAGGGW
jgi:hypothetical protein